MQSKLNKYLLAKRNTYIPVSFSVFADKNIFLDKIAGLLENGADIIELRETSASAAEILAVGMKLRELTALFGALFIIFDRVDLAKLLEADGIALDAGSMSVKNAQALVENSMLIGFYAEDEQQALKAQNDDADYIIAHEEYKNINLRIFFAK